MFIVYFISVCPNECAVIRKTKFMYTHNRTVLYFEIKNLKMDALQK